jgi:WD40 repeat protein
MRIWLWPARQIVASLDGGGGHPQAVHSVAFGPDGTRLASAGDDRALIWEWASNRPPVVLGAACQPQGCQHADSVNSIAFSPNGTRVVTASSDTTARVWDVSSGQLIGSSMKHANQLTAAVFWGDDRLVVGSKDRTAHVWDVQRGQELEGFTGHAGIVNSVALSRDGRWLATASYDTTARIWDTATRALVAIIPWHADTVWSASFSSDADARPRLITASADGTARVFLCDVCASVAELRALAGSRVTRELTSDERQRFLHRAP